MAPADPNLDEPRISVEAMRLFLEALKIGMRLLPAFVGPLAFALGRERPSTDAASIADARELLCKDSALDPSQAEGVVDGPTREAPQISGPPGTGTVRLSDILSSR